MLLSDIWGGMDVYVYPGKSLLLGQPKTKNDNKGQLKEKGPGTVEILLMNPHIPFL